MSDQRDERGGSQRMTEPDRDFAEEPAIEEAGEEEDVELHGGGGKGGGGLGGGAGNEPPVYPPQPA
jgi:hypothetical protein